MYFVELESGWRVNLYGLRSWKYFDLINPLYSQVPRPGLILRYDGKADDVTYEGQDAERIYRCLKGFVKRFEEV